MGGQHEQWADRVFMKYDVVLVAVCNVLLTLTALIDAPEVLPHLLLAQASVAGVWLMGCGPLRGLPFNPIQCAIHIAGWFIHTGLAANVCSSSASSLRVAHLYTR